MNFLRTTLQGGILLLGLLSTSLTAQDSLLPVTQAYPLSVTVSAGVIHLNWHIAPGYYLYRSRIKAESLTPKITLGSLQLPPGETLDDPYLGSEVIYRQHLKVTLPYQATNDIDSLQLQVSYQGCHEIKPKICYPPYTQTLTLALPTIRMNTVNSGLLKAATRRPAGFQLRAFTPSSNTPLPPNQAFRFSAQASTANILLLHWQMPPRRVVHQL